MSKVSYFAAAAATAEPRCANGCRRTRALSPRPASCPSPRPGVGTGNPEKACICGGALLCSGENPSASAPPRQKVANHKIVPRADAEVEADE